MKRSETRARRGEGYVEYIILTTIMMVCALVGMVTLTDGFKLVALERHLCVSCPANMSVEDLEAKKREYAGDPKMADERAKIEEELKYRAKRRSDAVAALSDERLRDKEAELAALTNRSSDQEATLGGIREEKARRKKIAADKRAVAGMGEGPAGADPGAIAVTEDPLVLGPYLPVNNNEIYDPLGIVAVGSWFSDYFRIPSGAPLFYDFANYWASLNFWGLG